MELYWTRKTTTALARRWVRGLGCDQKCHVATQPNSAHEIWLCKTICKSLYHDKCLERKQSWPQRLASASHLIPNISLMPPVEGVTNFLSLRLRIITGRQSTNAPAPAPNPSPNQAPTRRNQQFDLWPEEQSAPQPNRQSRTKRRSRTNRQSRPNRQSTNAPAPNPAAPNTTAPNTIPNQAPTTWRNQQTTIWPEQQSASYPNQSSATCPNQTNPLLPNQADAPFLNQANSPGPLPNRDHHTCVAGCSNGSPVFVTNNNYYPHPSAYVANVPLPVTWPTIPVYFVPSDSVIPVALPAVASPVAAWSAPAPAWNAQPTVPGPAPPAPVWFHPMLSSTPVTYPHLSWSIGRPVSTARICTQVNAERALSDAELNAQAVHPSISAIRIHVSALREWQGYWGPIVVPQLTSRGMRNKDVLRGIFNYFQAPLTRFEINRLHRAHRDLVIWQAERRAGELPTGGVSSEVERNRGLLRIDLVWAAIGGVKFSGMNFAVMQGWNTGEFSLNLMN